MAAVPVSMRRLERRLLLRNVNQPDTQSRTGPAILIACVASLLSTMLGIGGGVVMVPLLTLFARTPIKRAASRGESRRERTLLPSTKSKTMFRCI